MKLPVLLLAALPLMAQKPLVEGKAESPVRVVVYEDLQCPDCAAFRVMLDQKLLPKYGAKVAFEHRDFPLAKHSWARPASVAARYFQSISPELAVRFRQETMKSLREIKVETFADWVRRFAERNGQDPAQAVAALADEKLQAAVDKDFQEGVARGIARTPTALVNGVPFIETFTFEEISRGIDEALEENGIK
jgi:protein-disulfide isomerase